MSAIIKTCRVCQEEYVQAGPADNGHCSPACYRLTLARAAARRPTLSAMKACEESVLVKPEPKGVQAVGAGGVKWDV
jgi:hypothetical protein